MSGLGVPLVYLYVCVQNDAPVQVQELNRRSEWCHRRVFFCRLKKKKERGGGGQLVGRRSSLPIQ